MLKKKIEIIYLHVCVCVCVCVPTTIALIFGQLPLDISRPSIDLKFTPVEVASRNAAIRLIAFRATRYLPKESSPYDKLAIYTSALYIYICIIVCVCVCVLYVDR